MDRDTQSLTPALTGRRSVRTPSRGLTRLAMCLAVLVGSLVVSSAGNAATRLQVTTLESQQVGTGVPLADTPAGMLFAADGSYMATVGEAAGFGIAWLDADGVSEGVMPFNGQFFGGRRIGVARGIVRRADGAILVADSSFNRIWVINPDGTVQGSFGEAGSGNGQFDAPLGMALAPDNTILVADGYNNRIQRLAADGTFIASYGTAGSANGEFQLPTSIAVNPDGSFWVTDAGNSRLQRLAANGTHQLTFGSAGPGNTQFMEAYQVERLSNGDLLVLDAGQHRIRRFTAAGTFVSGFGGQGSGPGQLDKPISMAIAPDGRIFVSERTNERISVFAADGTFIERRHQRPTPSQDRRVSLATIPVPGSPNTYYMLNRAPAIGGEAPHLRTCTLIPAACTTSPLGTPGVDYRVPLAMDVGPDGTIYVADLADGMIKHLSASGSLLQAVGNGIGSAPGQMGNATVLERAADGSFWLGDGLRQRLVHLAADGSLINEIVLPAWVMSVPGLEVLSSGDIVATYAGDTQVELARYTSNGSSVWSRLSGPNDSFTGADVVELGDGSLLLGGAHITQRSAVDGRVIREAASPKGMFPSTIVGLGLLADGRVIGGDTANSRHVLIEVVHEQIVIEPSIAPPTVTRGTGTLTFAVSGAGGTVTFSASFGGSAVSITSSGVIRVGDIPEGRRILRVMAVDADGNQAVWEQVLVVDRTAPKIRNPRRFVTSARVVLRVEDALSGVAQRSRVVSATHVGRNRFDVRVVDRAGNSARRTIVLHRRPSLVRGVDNRGIRLWRPGGAPYAPGTAALTMVFGRLADGEAPGPYGPGLVREVQYRLKQRGLISRVVRSSGRLDSTTSRALRRFQRRAGITPSGVPDLRTRRTLDMRILEVSL